MLHLDVYLYLKVRGWFSLFVALRCRLGGVDSHLTISDPQHSSNSQLIVYINKPIVAIITIHIDVLL